MPESERKRRFSGKYGGNSTVKLPYVVVVRKWENGYNVHIATSSANCDKKHLRYACIKADAFLEELIGRQPVSERAIALEQALRVYIQ